MQKILEDFLKNINNGRLFKAQITIASKLNIARASVSKWCSGKAMPSEENIKKMA
ncbi:MAG: helix-turn-helix transcriptional regulator, partial [Elusimicrobia bacterium]|nr:helix-turn-helix transcriptional regulator [Elusimicrobiota bacterium]